MATTRSGGGLAAKAGCWALCRPYSALLRALVCEISVGIGVVVGGRGARGLAAAAAQLQHRYGDRRPRCARAGEVLSCARVGDTAFGRQRGLCLFGA